MAPPPTHRTAADPRFKTRLVVIFAVLALLIWSTGIFSLTRLRQQHEASVKEELGAILKLKIEQIVNWRRELMEDAIQVMRTPWMGRSVQTWFNDPNNESTRLEIAQWLDSLQSKSPCYAAILLDTQLKIRLHSPLGAIPTNSVVEQTVRDAMQSNQIVVSDLHRSGMDNKVHMDLAIPIRPIPATNTISSTPAGVLLLHLNPYQFMFPMVQRWPTLSPSGETLLVRHEKEQIVFLNELRHRTNSAAKLRIPLSEYSDLPVTRTIRGNEGVWRGLDYRQVEVIAAGGRVPDSPWFMVVKVDLAEADAPLRAQYHLFILLSSILTLATGLGIGLVWQQRAANFARQQLLQEQARLVVEAERQELARKLTTLMANLPGLAYRCQNDEHWTMEFVSEGCLELTGYPSSAFINNQQLAYADIILPEDRNAVWDAVQFSVNNGKPFTIHYRIRRADGSERWVMEKGQGVYSRDGELLALEGFITDISLLKRAESELQESRQKLQAMLKQ